MPFKQVFTAYTALTLHLKDLGKEYINTPKPGLCWFYIHQTVFLYWYAFK